MKRATDILSILCIAALGMLALTGLSSAAMQMFFRFPLGYGENDLIVGAWGLLNGHGLYRLSETEKIPAFIAAYPPVYYLIVAACMKIFGLSYVPGRLIALLSGIGCAVLVGAIARRRGGGTAGAIIGAAAFAASWPVALWIRYARVDLTAVFFELAAVFVLMGGAKKWRSIAFVILAVLAGYTKQSAFAIVLGALVGLFLEGGGAQRKRIIIISLCYALSAAAVFLFLQIITGGDFYKFSIYFVQLDVSAGQFSAQVARLLADPPAVIIVALSVLFLALGKSKRFFFPFILIPMAAALATVGKIGSNLNYFIGSLAVYSVAVAQLAGYSNRPSRKWVSAAVSPASFVALIVCSVLAFHIRMPILKKWLNQYRQIEYHTTTHESVMHMKKYLGPGSLVYAQYPELALFAGFMPAVSDPWQFAALSEESKWDQSPLLSALGERRIAMIIMREVVTTDKRMEFMSREAARAVLENYRLTSARPDGFNVYVPKSFAQR